MSGILQGLLASLAAAAKYELYSWGTNASGNLGLNDTNRRSSPVQVGALTDWGKIGNNRGAHFVAVKEDNTLWSWGLNSQGELGLNDRVNRSSPVQIGSLTTWEKSCSAVEGNQVSFAIKKDGTLWAWGGNSYGVLGLNDTARRSSPVQVGALTTWDFVSSCGSHTLAGKSDGTLWAWGRNTKGELGNNSFTSAGVGVSSPIQIGALTDWATVSAGQRCSFAIKTGGTLWAWGYQQFGRLGNNESNTLINRSSPIQIGSLTNWAKINSSATNALAQAVKTDGTLWSWGANGLGQLGQNISIFIDVSSPVQVGALTNWGYAYTESSRVIAIKTDKTLWGWGENYQGQLGLNDRTRRSSPVQIGSRTDWYSAAATNFGGLAVTKS